MPWKTRSLNFTLCESFDLFEVVHCRGHLAGIQVHLLGCLLLLLVVVVCAYKRYEDVRQRLLAVQAQDHSAGVNMYRRRVHFFEVGVHDVETLRSIALKLNYPVVEEYDFKGDRDLVRTRHRSSVPVLDTFQSLFFISSIYVLCSLAPQLFGHL